MPCVGGEATCQAQLAASHSHRTRSRSTGSSARICVARASGTPPQEGGARKAGAQRKQLAGSASSERPLQSRGTQQRRRVPVRRQRRLAPAQAPAAEGPKTMRVRVYCICMTLCNDYCVRCERTLHDPGMMHVTAPSSDDTSTPLSCSKTHVCVIPILSRMTKCTQSADAASSRSARACAAPAHPSSAHTTHLCGPFTSHKVSDTFKANNVAHRSRSMAAAMATSTCSTRRWQMRSARVATRWTC